jgi:hypothetical protein
MTKSTSVILAGTVEKIIKSDDPSKSDEAQIVIGEKETPLYGEIRIENALADQDGAEVKLKAGANVKITIKARTV